MLYMRQQDLHKQPVYFNMPYANILPYCNISLEMLLKLSKTESTYLIAPDIKGFLLPRGRLGHSHYAFV